MEGEKSVGRAIQKVKRLGASTAMAVLLLAPLGATGAFAATAAKPAAHKPSQVPTVVLKVVRSPQFATFLHVSTKTVALDLKHHETLLQMASAHKIVRARLVGEIGALVRDDAAAEIKAHRLTTAKAVVLEKQAYASLASAIVNKDLAAKHRRTLSGKLLKEVAAILHTKPALVLKQRRKGESLVKMAAAKHITEAVLVRDLVNYRLKTAKKHKPTVAVLDKEMVRMVVKK